jgi:MYXO-CTERM domain-containing protein
MDASVVRIICGLVAVALLALIVMRRRSRQVEED